MKQLIKEITPYQKLYRDTNNGIAWIEDGSTGCGISIHPNISTSGSVRGMKHLGYWQKQDRIIKSHGFAYNVDLVSFSWDDPTDPYYKLEHLVADECMCIACYERRSEVK